MTLRIPIHSIVIQKSKPDFLHLHEIYYPEVNGETFIERIAPEVDVFIDFKLSDLVLIFFLEVTKIEKRKGLWTEYHRQKYPSSQLLTGPDLCMYNQCTYIGTPIYVYVCCVDIYLILNWN